MDESGDGITKEDFLQSGWEGVIAECDDKECARYSSRFNARAREAEESGDKKGQQIFVLLSSITSMYFKLDTPNEPFGPMMAFHDRRTAMVDDFSEDELKLLGQVVADISDPELRARIADVLWLRKRDFRMAELAIASYLESAKRLEDPEKWVGTVDRIERALHLVAMLGRNSRLFTTVIEHIECVLATYNGEDPLFLSARLMHLLQERRVGDPIKYAALAEKSASRAESTRDWHRAREYWGIKGKWHSLGNEQEQARQAKLAEAETYVKQAQTHLDGTPPSHMMAATFTQNAIEAFRRINGTKERVEELHKALLEYQKHVVSEMVPYSSSVDISDMVRVARDHVKGKTLLDALMNLAMLGNPPFMNSTEYRQRFGP